MNTGDAPRNLFAEVNAELWELASRACNGTLSAEDQRRLEATLASDENARQFYGLFMMMHSGLVWQFRSGAPHDGEQHVTLAQPSPASQPAAPLLPLAPAPTPGVPLAASFLPWGTVFAAYALSL